MTGTDKRGALHLIKLSVGSTSLLSLMEWQAARCAERAQANTDPRPRHVTRMRPKRAKELLEGGSIFWVIQGEIQARQVIADISEVRGEDGIRRCALIFEPPLIPVLKRPKRAFQGWRYLTELDAPPDIEGWSENDEPLPDGMREELEKFGLF